MLLRILSGPRQNDVVHVTEPITIGRAEQNQVVLPDAKVSRQHVQVWEYEGKWFLKNLQPSNPVFIDRKPYSSTVQMKPGMMVQIGETFVQFDGETTNPTATTTHGPTRTTPPYFSILLGGGAGGLILALVFLLSQGPTLTPEQIGATQTAIVLASASATPTATPSATPTETVTPTPTATVTPTPLPPLQPEPGRLVEEVYTPDKLAPATLDELGVPAEGRDLLIHVPYAFTNNSQEPIAVSDITVGVFANVGPDGERQQVHSFVVPSEDGTIDPGETQTLEWLVVLPQGRRVEALAVLLKGESIRQDFPNEATTP